VPLSRFVQPIRQTTTSSQLSPTIPLRAQKIVGGWLMGCAGMCFGAVVLGGVTRLVTIQSETNTEFCSIIVYTVSTCTTIHHIFDNDVMCFTSQIYFYSFKITDYMYVL
jgi:hypothetical protein